MCERKSAAYHFENHIVTGRNYRYAYSLAALVRELIFKKRIKTQCNFWTDSASGPRWACDDFPVTALISSLVVHLRQWRTRAASPSPGVGSGIPQASPCWCLALTSMLYLSTVLLRGSTACQQMRIHRSISSMPPTITSSFWSLMICREERKRVDVREIPQTEAERPGRGRDCHSCLRIS